jgi:hypothetical protein
MPWSRDVKDSICGMDGVDKVNQYDNQLSRTVQN